MNRLVKYRKYILFLSVWVVACSVYFLWGSFGPLVFLRYIHTMKPGLVEAQQDSVASASSVGRTTLTSKSEKSSVGGNGSVAKEEGAGVSTESKPPASKSAELPGSPPGKSVAGGAVTPSTKLNFTKTAEASLVISVKDPFSSEKASSSSSSSPTQPSSSNNASSTETRPPTDNPSPKLLCVRFTGRLGNELFEYASTLGLALSQNRIPVFLGSTILHTVLKNFKVSPSSLSLSELEQRCRQAKGLTEDSCCKYKEQMAKLDPQYDYRISFYLQSYRYFENQEDAVRKALTFNDEIQKKVDGIVNDLRQKHPSSTLVGVHIRHGDMALPHNQQLGYPVASSAYINKSLSYFHQLYPRCVFVVASDSLKWCQENFPKGYNVQFLGQDPPAVDMAVLAKMDHVITSFGSFSWWIGYLNRGKTVYMKDFIIANTFIGQCFNPKGRDYIYPGWVPL